MGTQDTPILWVEPVWKEMIWGGERLRTEFHYEIPSDHTGECWAISARSNGDCKITGGIYDGSTLTQLWTEAPQLFGYLPYEQFPLLVKILDAKEDLSIQVHPDDFYAKQHEGGPFGKSECWYILDCEEGAELVVGHHATSQEELYTMVMESRWTDLLRSVPIKKGDFIQIDSGTIHTIKGGIMIFEIQQNCDVTYRLYDYNRYSNGELRELHVKESLDVMTVPSKPIEDVLRPAAQLPSNRMNRLITSKYYTVWKIEVTDSVILQQEYPFLICSVIEGEGSIDGQKIIKGRHFILPFRYGSFELHGKMQLIMSTIEFDMCHTQ
ncbi:MAG: mannose-6-phosphate isomerase, class I [Lachnospiraceae bacterium]